MNNYNNKLYNIIMYKYYLVGEYAGEVGEYAGLQ